MRYAELGRYVEALERSGGDGRKLRVERALKIAVPFTCIIIAMFGAPLANAGALQCFDITAKFGVPLFLVLPAAVLFATVFTVGALARNSEPSSPSPRGCLRPNPP